MNIFFLKQNDSKEKKPSIHIGLEHNGILLYDIFTDDFEHEITIGRSSQCEWHLNTIDESASSKHAVISCRKGNYYLTDLGSLNGIYYLSKRISERKLSIGDKISIGECVLFVDNESKNIKRFNQMNQLEYTNNSGRKVVYDIVKPETTIGSGKECGICIPDQLISSHHAKITLRNDGSCWLKDCGSRNGTSVNGKELSDDTERMLQEGDIVTIAYLELKFLDASVIHENSRVLTSIVIVGITILAALGSYVGYMQLTPSAEDILKFAKREASLQNFDSARKLLGESKLARNADDNILERESIYRQINLWENTMKIWKMAQEDLISEAFNLANNKLSSIDHADLNVWNWNNHGAFTEKSKAQAVKTLLDNWSSAEALLMQESEPVEKIERQRNDLSFAIHGGEKYRSEKYMSPLLRVAQKTLARLDKTLDENKQLIQIVGMLNHEKPDYKTIIRRLENISSNSLGAVQARAKRLLIPIRNLNRETDRMLSMVAKVANLQFAEVDAFYVNLPDSVDYSSEKNIASLKKDLIDSSKKLKDSSIQLSMLHHSLNQKGVIVGKKVEVIESFFDSTVMSKVYSFDILDMPLPKSARQMPSGEYDRILGYEFMYDYIKNIHSGMMTININELPFPPQIYLTKEIFIETEKFISYADRDENLWFHDGELKKYIDYCREIIKSRDRIIKQQLAVDFPRNSRPYIVAHGIASYIGSDSNLPKGHKQMLSNAFLQLNKEIQLKDRLFSRSMPEEQLKIRDEIIHLGLPGDPIVRKMWRMRPAEGWKK